VLFPSLEPHAPSHEPHNAFCRLNQERNARLRFLEALQNEPYNAPPFPAGSGLRGRN
jgi:hypothetical protein